METENKWHTVCSAIFKLILSLSQKYKIHQNMLCMYLINLADDQQTYQLPVIDVVYMQ